MVAPRALYLENGDQDPLFPVEDSLREWDRLKPYYEAANASERLLLHHGAFGHCVDAGELGLKFFLKNLIEYV